VPRWAGDVPQRLTLTRPRGIPSQTKRQGLSVSLYGATVCSANLSAARVAYGRTEGSVFSRYVV
jgi:hypothetical protein